MTDLARALPLRGIEEIPQRRLHVVDAPARRRPRLAYGITAVAGAIAIALAQMTLSILTTQGGYEVAALQQEQRELTYQKQILADEVAGLSSPQFLAANAAALGMVTGDVPSYLRLSDGAIVGTGQAASATSAVDAIGRGSVQNSLIADTPLVTAPGATIEGVPLAPVTETAGEDGFATPLPIADGLPAPATR